MSDQKNKVVLFNGATQHSFSAKADCLVTLNAGSNVVSIAKLDKLMGTTGDKKQDACKSNSFLEMMEDGVIQVIDDKAVVVAETTQAETDNSGAKKPSDDKIEINIAELGATEAKAVINSEIDADVIQGYLDAENAGEARSSVVKACDKAIEALLSEESNEEK